MVERRDEGTRLPTPCEASILSALNQSGETMRLPPPPSSPRAQRSTGGTSSSHSYGSTPPPLIPSEHRYRHRKEWRGRLSYIGAGLEAFALVRAALVVPAAAWSGKVRLAATRGRNALGLESVELRERLGLDVVPGCECTNCVRDGTWKRGRAETYAPGCRGCQT